MHHKVSTVLEWMLQRRRGQRRIDSQVRVCCMCSLSIVLDVARLTSRVQWRLEPDQRRAASHIRVLRWRALLRRVFVI